jgi:cold-inducible RNA-binding protein
VSARLFVGNLSFKATQEQLRNFVEASIGAELKDVHVPTKNDASGNNKGFAFVELQPAFKADDAIQLLDGAEFLGRRLNVSFAHARSGGRN